MLCALFWKRTNKWGALAGILSGGAVVFIWKFAIRPLGGAWNIYELLPAFIVSLLFIIVISLVTPKPSKEITDTFDAVKAELKGAKIEADAKVEADGEAVTDEIKAEVAVASEEQ